MKTDYSDVCFSDDFGCASSERSGNLMFDYATQKVSTKMVKIIQSYTGIVDKIVWRKGF